MRLIDADELLTAFPVDDEPMLTKSCVRMTIQHMPTIEPEQPEIIHCKDCKYAEVADTEDGQDGYTCQFHRGSIWFSGSYCSWAERRQE